MRANLIALNGAAMFVNERRACVLLLGPTRRVQCMTPGPFAEAHYWELMKSIRTLN
jgi:hypothetical protein